MSDKIFVGKNVTSLDTAPEFDSYAGVIINTSDDTYVYAGDISGELGRVLTLDNPWGTATMAQNILTSLSGFQYQPYSADGAILNPAAEIGDGVTISGMYSGIYTQEVRFSTLMRANVSAPQDEAIDHEYPFQSSTDKKIQRQWLDTKSELTVLATEITAKVSKESPAGQTSFGWRLNDTSWEVFNQGGTILKATADGLEVTGKVTATSGTIGGFNISASSIWNNLPSMSGTQSQGVYIGTDGIKLGQNFQVDNSGNLTASNASFAGAVTCTSLNVASNTGCNIGGYSFSGSDIASGVFGGGGYSLATNRDSGIYPSYFKSTLLNCTYFSCTGILGTGRGVSVNDVDYTPQNISYAVNGYCSNQKYITNTGWVCMANGVETRNVSKYFLAH